MKEIRTKHFAHKISLIVFIIALVTNLSCFIAERISGNTFFFHGISSRNLHYFLGVTLLVSGICFLIMCVRNKNLIHCLLLLSGVVLVLLWSVFPAICMPDLGYYAVLSSPDGTHTVVVRELSMYHSCSITFYQKVSPFFMQYKAQNQKPIEKTQPIQSGHYTTVWEESGATISLLDIQNGSVLETVFIALN